MDQQSYGGFVDRQKRVVPQEVRKESTSTDEMISKNGAQEIDNQDFLSRYVDA